jgi:transcriptional regulator with XRE-family HTH domain
MSNIGDKLRTLRQREGLTTRQLGAILGVSNVHIVRIENGQRKPSIDLVEKMSRFFQVTTDQLIKDELDITGES